MKLNVFECMELKELLPTKEDYPGLLEIVRLEQHLLLSPEDMEICGQKDEKEGRWVITPEKGTQYVREIPIGEWMTNTIREKLRSMHERHQLEKKHMSLYEKFIVDYGMVS